MTSPARSKHEPRVEDDALVRGQGRFMDDPRLPNQAYAAFVRSPHAHARVLKVDAEAARKAKKVLAVLTAADMKAAGVGSVSRHPPVPGRGGAKMIMPFRPALAGDKVMHVGDPVAMVVAETAAAALDAADLVVVDYEELPAVVDLDTAMNGKTQLYPDAPGNLCVDWPGPVPDEQNEATWPTSSPRRRMWRACASPTSAWWWPRWKRAAPPASTTRQERELHAVCLLAGRRFAARPGRRHHGRAEREAARDHRGRRRRLRHEDAGLSGISGAAGGGARSSAARCIGSRRARKPSSPTRRRATPSRKSSSRSTTRASSSRLRVRHLCNQGAYVSTAGVGINTNNFARCLPGMYRIPKVDVSVACYFSNTIPIGPYRGAGRPEANYALERVVEEAARITGIDRVRLRKKNLIPPSAMPFKTPINTYDSGDFPGIVDKALELADYDNFNKRRRESAKRKKLRGIGVSCMLEHAGALPMEQASVAFPGDDKIDPRLQRAVDRPGPRHGVRPPARRSISASMRPRSSTSTATPRRASPALPRSARARPCAPAMPSSTSPT